MRKRSKSYAQVKQHRETRRDICTVAMGGKCQICGYNRCRAALEVHHIDPDEKEISFQEIVSWDKVYSELEKCILLCATCHREVHAGVVTIPEEYFRFDRMLADSLRSKQSLSSQHSNYAEIRKVAKAKREESQRRRVYFIEERKRLVLQSGVDFTAWGWMTELAKVLGISSQKTRVWIKNNMPELFESSRKSNK